jgi:hypothetical protein
MSRPTSASSENTYGCGVEGRGGRAPARGGGGGERDRNGLDGGDCMWESMDVIKGCKATVQNVP